MPEEFDPEKLEGREEVDPYIKQGGRAIQPKPDASGSGLSPVEEGAKKVTRLAAAELTGGASEAARKIPGVGKLIDAATDKLAKYFTKNFWKTLLLANWPTLTTIAIVIILLVVILVPAFGGIAKARRGAYGGTPLAQASVLSGDDAAALQEAIGKNPGGLILPAQGHNKSEITSPWGQQRGTYVHRGIDIMLPIGTKYYASSSGIVEYLKDDIPEGTKGYSVNGGFGNAIVVKVTGGKWDGFFWEIHHLHTGTASAAGLKVGSTVLQGQYIGQSGDNGASTGGHIHFQVDIPNVAFGKPTKAQCEDVVMNLHRPCGAGTDGLPYDTDTINPIVALGW